MSMLHGGPSDSFVSSIHIKMGKKGQRGQKGFTQESKTSNSCFFIPKGKAKSAGNRTKTIVCASDSNKNIKEYYSKKSPATTVGRSDPNVQLPTIADSANSSATFAAAPTNADKIQLTFTRKEWESTDRVLRPKSILLS